MERYIPRFDQVLATYEALAKQAAHPELLTLVMTDVIGQQAISLDLYAHYAPRIAQLIVAGADVLVPVPNGDLSSAEFYHRVAALVGSYDFRVGFPSNKAAWAPEDIACFLRQAPQVSKVHLLGMSPYRRGPFQARLRVLHAFNPAVDITCDANRMASQIASQGSIGQQIAEYCEDHIEDLSEMDRVYGGVNLATTDLPTLAALGDFCLADGQLPGLFHLHADTSLSSTDKNDALWDCLSQDWDDWDEFWHNLWDWDVIRKLFHPAMKDGHRPTARRQSIADFVSADLAPIQDLPVTLFYSGMTEKRDFLATFEGGAPIGVSLKMKAASPLLMSLMVAANVAERRLFVDTGIFGITPKDGDTISNKASEPVSVQTSLDLFSDVA